jgi:hypothetical protein
MKQISPSNLETQSLRCVLGIPRIDHTWSIVNGIIAFQTKRNAGCPHQIVNIRAVLLAVAIVVVPKGLPLKLCMPAREFHRIEQAVGVIRVVNPDQSRRVDLFRGKC